MVKKKILLLIKNIKMSSWVDYLKSWVSTDVIYGGPARNAPNGGVNIRVILDQRPKQVMCVDQDTVVSTLKSLKKTIINAQPPISNKPPLMKDFDNVFEMGYKEFFAAKAAARAAKLNRHVVESADIIIEENMSEVEA